jgi:sugar phosphate isomerase/epimerase
LQTAIAAFPKCYMDDLCLTGRMSLFTWLEIAATLEVDGVELYPGFFPTFDRGYLECIEQVLPYAAERGVILALENHYKDNYWTYPEFALPFKLFQRIVDAIDSPWFGVNFDPSNAILAGEDPLVVLEAVKARVVSMHASDRHLLAGYTLEDLRAQEGQQGYAHILRHGEIGTGLNDYPAIVRILEEIDFHGWISIEDGVDGIEELRRSIRFVRKVLAHDATK